MLRGLTLKDLAGNPKIQNGFGKINLPENTPVLVYFKNGVPTEWIIDSSAAKTISANYNQGTLGIDGLKPFNEGAIKFSSRNQEVNVGYKSYVKGRDAQCTILDFNGRKVRVFSDRPLDKRQLTNLSEALHEEFVSRSKLLKSGHPDPYKDIYVLSERPGSTSPTERRTQTRSSTSEKSLTTEKLRSNLAAFRRSAQDTKPMKPPTRGIGGALVGSMGRAILLKGLITGEAFHDPISGAMTTTAMTLEGFTLRGAQYAEKAKECQKALQAAQAAGDEAKVAALTKQLGQYTKGAEACETAAKIFQKFSALPRPDLSSMLQLKPNRPNRKLLTQRLEPVLRQKRCWLSQE